MTLTSDSAYVIGAPGSAVVAIVSDDVPSDLVVRSVTAPALAGAGATITVSDTTANQGSGSATASTTGLYLSNNVLLDSKDPSVGTRTVPALTAGGSNTGATAVTIPDGTAPGTYYILAKADSAGVIAETQESNNTKWSNAILVGPDLVVSGVTAPSAAAPGGSIVVGDTTLNRGGGATAAASTSFYLSTNLIFDASDVPLGARSVDGLAAGAASAGTTTLTIPAEIAAGTYYIVAQADSANAVAEAVESNNIAFSTAIHIGLDLTVSRITAPAVAGAGAAIVIVDTTLDRGTAAAPPSTTGFYLSSNFALDAGDLVLGNRPVPALEAGASDTASTSLSVPATVATGTYFIVARADNANAVAEANESNNLAFSSAIRIGPDLTQGTTTAPATGGSGGSIVIGDTAKNTGGGAAGASTTGLYLSTSVTLTASATQLGARSVPPLAPGRRRQSSARDERDEQCGLRRSDPHRTGSDRIRAHGAHVSVRGIGD